jgi:hypothetical protein
MFGEEGEVGVLLNVFEWEITNEQHGVQDDPKRPCIEGFCDSVRKSGSVDRRLNSSGAM